MDSTTRTYICEQCHKVFKTKNYLQMHKQRIHPDGPPVSCPQCGKSFIHIINLKHHQKTHLAPIHHPFACDQCPRTFKTKEYLTKHQLVHAGERSFSCTQCAKTFAHKSTLTFHLVSHSMERPFVCEQEKCDKTFKHKTHLRRHQVCHTGERPYSCEICEENFSRKDNLTHHVKRFHPTKENEGDGLVQQFKQEHPLKMEKETLVEPSVRNLSSPRALETCKAEIWRSW